MDEREHLERVDEYYGHPGFADFDEVVCDFCGLAPGDLSFRTEPFVLQRHRFRGYFVACVVCAGHIDVHDIESLWRRARGGDADPPGSVIIGRSEALLQLLEAFFDNLRGG